MKFVIVLVLIVAGVAGGGTLGVWLRPDVPPAKAAEQAAADREAADETGARDYVKFTRKIVVPVVEGRETRALLVFDLAIDVPAAASDRVYGMKPRLRDAFLRVFYQMASTGAFLETYTDARIMRELRDKLLAAAREHGGPRIREVLILDMIRTET